jgi:tRNA-modifying protein YgfZ
MAQPRVAHLPSRVVIALSGPDWRSFLQGLLTQDVEGLAPGELRFGALLTPQGRLLYDLFITAWQDGCLLDVERAWLPALVQRLTIYRLRAKVEIAEAPVTVYAAWPQDPAPPGWLADPRLPALGARGYRVSDIPAPTATEADYDAHRLSLGVPGPADWGTEKTYPIEANFDLLNGVDFKKGCFVGQETTSRMKRRGQVKSRMLPIAFEGPPPAYGREVLAGELRAGEVLSGMGGRAMAALRLDRALGASLTVEGRPVRVEQPTWFRQAALTP